MKYFVQLLIMSFITLCLFVLLNAVALLFIPDAPVDTESQFFISAVSERGLQINAKVQGVDDRTLLRAIMKPPGLAAHPALHFGEGPPSQYYSVSLEGVRKSPNWSDAFLGGLLEETGKHTFVMGGSTTFGHGVKDADTLVAILNRNATASGDYFLNFGTQSYDSVREIQKLNNLLSKGYRPAQVLFIDGLNDITTRWRCVYQLQDCFRHREYIGGIPTPSLRQQLLWKLPIVQAFMPPAPTPEWQSVIEERPSPYTDPIIRPEMAFPPQSELVDQLADRLTEDYRTQLGYLRELAAGFDFKLAVVIHPIGFLDRGNPFVQTAFFDDDSYIAWNAMFKQFRMRLANEANVFDCSNAITEPENAYVDASHFSARGAAQLAECIKGAL